MKGGFKNSCVWRKVYYYLGLFSKILVLGFPLEMLTDFSLTLLFFILDVFSFIYLIKANFPKSTNLIHSV